AGGGGWPAGGWPAAARWADITCARRSTGRADKMSIYTNPPEWEEHGRKPPSSKRREGWKPGDRVPASWLNWFWFSTVNSLREIAGAFVSHRDATSGVHGVPEGETIATARYVDGRLDAHIADKNNPHGVTKAQVGLGSVENYGVATQAEAEAGTVNNKYMTPLRTKQAIDALAVVYPVPVTSLKRANGTMSGSSVGSVFAVHQYAFASPLRGIRTSGGDYSVGIIPGAQDYDQSYTRQWAGMRIHHENNRWGDP